MNEDKQPQAQPQREQDTRRKLIKGLAGLPAVLTLGNGAHAATASNLACLAKNPPEVPEDNAYVATTAPTGSPPPPNNAHCLDLDNNPGPPPADTGLTKVVEYGDYDSHPNGPLYNTGAGTPARLEGTTWRAVPGPFGTTYTNDTQACVVYVDGTNPNNVQYYVSKPLPNSDTLPTTASCYASFTPNI
jgi:hypothetical protein